MKKLSILVLILGFLFIGCAHNEHMASIEKARWEAYGQAMKAYYNNLPENRRELINLQLDESGKLQGLKVYDSKTAQLPLPNEPREIKPWASQMTDSVANSKVVETAIKWTAGLFAVKIITDNAGHNTSGSYNSDRHDVTTTTDDSIKDSYNDSRQIDESVNTDTANSNNISDSNNPIDNSQHDSNNHDEQWMDNRENYENDQRENYENQQDDNRENYDNDQPNYQDQYSGDFENIPEITEP
ncbi:MAG: hypothetical protein U9P90_01480 [Patescibacteria group bacterium]|nr:hypothetical protein [Patescibacteria group bacterium]